MDKKVKRQISNAKYYQMKRANEEITRQNSVDERQQLTAFLSNTMELFIQNVTQENLKTTTLETNINHLVGAMDENKKMLLSEIVSLKMRRLQMSFNGDFGPVEADDPDEKAFMNDLSAKTSASSGGLLSAPTDSTYIKTAGELAILVSTYELRLKAAKREIARREVEPMIIVMKTLLKMLN